MRKLLLLIFICLGVVSAHAQAISLPNYVNASQSPATYWVPQNIQLNPTTSTISFSMVGYASKAAYTSGAMPVDGATHNYSTGLNISSAQYTTYFASATISTLATQCVVAALAITDETVTSTNGTTSSVSFFNGGTQTT